MSKPQKPLNLRITIKGPRNRIYIGKDVIRALEFPPFICVKVNEDMSSLAIQPGEEKEYMSFKVPERLFESNKVEFTVHSKSFVHTLLAANGLDGQMNYPLMGVYSEPGNAVVFKVLQIHEQLGDELKNAIKIQSTTDPAIY